MAKNANDALWIWKYDSRGHLESRIGPDNDISRYRYKDDLLREITDAKGEKTHLHYNEAHLLEKAVLPNGLETEWRYTAGGQLRNVGNNENQYEAYRYDPLGRVTHIQTIDNNDVHLTYDALGNVLEAKDDEGKVSFAYSSTGKLLSREEKGRKVSFSYSSTDHLKGIKNAHKSIYRLERDALGNVISEEGFDGLRRVYERDAKGQISKVSIPEEGDTHYFYNRIGGISKIRYGDDREEVYTYDRLGALVQATNAEGDVRLERDALGRVVKETQGHISVESRYNREGQRTHIRSSLGANIEIDYDRYGDVSSTRASQGGSDWQSHIRRNLLGLEVERVLHGDIRRHWDRDKTGKPTRHSVRQGERCLLTDKRYDWGVNDRLRGIYDELAYELIRFNHDLFGNLASAYYRDGTKDYKLPDEIGNLFKTQAHTDRVYGKGGELLQDERYSYRYDNRGQLILKVCAQESWRYVWTSGGMLDTVIRPYGQKVQFTYDALGRRLTKRYLGKTTHFVWDGNTLLHEWTADAGQSHTEINAENALVHTEPRGLITWVFESGTFIPQAKLEGGRSYSILSDHLGTPFEAYDERGKKVWVRQLDIYGKTRTLEGDSAFCNFLYQGQYYDRETELAYNRFRYYSPNAGTYISQDPIGLAGNNPNFYAYVRDSNIWVDVFGLTGTYIFTDGTTSYIGKGPKKEWGNL